MNWHYLIAYLLSFACFFVLMFTHIRKQDFQAEPYEKIIDRLETEKVELQMRLSSYATEAESYRLDAIAWHEKATRWEGEARRYKDAIDRAAAQRIADIVEKRYIIDLN